MQNDGYPKASGVTDTSRRKNPVRDAEPPALDSGDQMPVESTFWGDQRGHQPGLSGGERQDRWLFKVRRWFERRP